MTEIPLQDGPLSIRGALALEPGRSGLALRRLPTWTRSQIDDIGMNAMVSMPAGVRLGLRTDATRLEIDAQITFLRSSGDPLRPACFDAVVDRRVVASAATSTGHQVVLDEPTVGEFRFEPGDAATIVLDALPAGVKDLEVWLPHTVMLELAAVRVPSGSSALPIPEPTAPTWVHYGSSISHCTEVDEPTAAWPVIAALATGAELVDLGFSANAMLDGYVARTIRDLPADLITLKLGINIVGADAMRERTFAAAVHAFLDTIRDGHPETPIVVVSPIHCPSLEDHPGPNVEAPDGRYVAIGGCDEIRAGCLTLVRVREILADLVERRRRLGDSHLRYLDGLDLLGADEAADLPDDLHPDAAGYARMGDRFAALVLRPSFAGSVR